MLLNQYARIGRVFKKQMPITVAISSNSFSVTNEIDNTKFESEFDIHTKSL